MKANKRRLAVLSIKTDTTYEVSVTTEYKKLVILILHAGPTGTNTKPRYRW